MVEVPWTEDFEEDLNIPSKDITASQTKQWGHCSLGKQTWVASGGLGRYFIQAELGTLPKLDFLLNCLPFSILSSLPFTSHPLEQFLNKSLDLKAHFRVCFQKTGLEKVPTELDSEKTDTQGKKENRFEGDTVGLLNIFVTSN